MSRRVGRNVTAFAFGFVILHGLDWTTGNLIRALLLVVLFFLHGYFWMED